MNEELKYSCQINADKFNATENEYYGAIKKLRILKKSKVMKILYLTYFAPH